MSNRVSRPVGRTIGGVIAALLLIIAPSSAGALGLQAGPEDDTHVVDEDSGQVVVEVFQNNNQDASLTGDFTAATKGSVQKVVSGDVTTGFTYEPAPDANGEDSFTYDYVVGEGDAAVTSTATVSVTIIPLPDAPVANDDEFPAVDGTPITERDEIAHVLDLPGNDTDADQDSTLTIVSIDAGEALGTVELIDGVVTYRATSRTATQDSFDYTISDGDDLTDDATATATINIVPVDDPPVANDDLGPDDLGFVVAEGATITIDVQANDTDVDGGENSVAIEGTPTEGTATVTDAGLVEYVHDGGEATNDSFTYSLNGQDQTATVSIAVTAVDDDPVAFDDPGDGAAIVVRESNDVDDEDSVLIDVLTNDQDVDDGPLFIASIGEVPIGEASIEDGQIRYTHTGDTLGDVSFSYTLNSQSEAAGSEATVTLSVVNADDDAPEVETPDTLQIIEDDLDGETVQILSNGQTDVDGSELSILSVGDPLKGAVTVTDGSVTYVPTADENGEDSFDVIVTDGDATVSNDVTITVSVTIEPVNDAPVADGDSYTSSEFDCDNGCAVIEDTPTLLSVLVNDSDIDGPTLAVDPESLQLDEEIGTLAVDAGGVLFTPADDYFGEFSFTYMATDGELRSEPASVSVKVTPTEDPLEAVADEDSMEEDDVIYIDVLDNDVDVDATGFSLVGVTQPESGFAVAAGDRVRVQPDPDFSGDLTFTYQIQAAATVAGTECSDPLAALFLPEGCELISGTVTVIVSAANDRPEAVRDTVETDEDTEITIDVLGNDTDADDDVLSIDRIIEPRLGTAEIVGNEVVYTPSPDVSGDDTFIYYATDGDLLSVAVAYITINPVNDAPTIEGAELETDEDTPRTFTVAVADIDSENLTISVATEPEAGALEIDGTSVTYTPAENDFGDYSFELTVTDDAAQDEQGSATATFTMAVASVNDLPSAEELPAFEIDEEGVLQGEVDVSDVEDDVLSSAVTTEPVMGSVELAGNGFVYTGAKDANGEDSFIVTFTDSDGGSVEVPVSVSINPVNDAPTIEGQTDLETDEDTPLTFTVVVDDIDSENLTLGFATEPVLDIEIDGFSVTYTPEDDFFGEVSFDLRVTDDAGEEQLSADAAFTVTVASVNDVPVAQDLSIEIDEEDEHVGAISVSDVEDKILVSEVTTDPTKGEVVELDGGNFIYVADLDETGVDFFIVTFTDSDGATVTARVSVNILPINDDPTIEGDYDLETNEDTPLTFEVAVGDVDGDDLDLELFESFSEECFFGLDPECWDICWELELDCWDGPTQDIRLARVIQPETAGGPYNGAFEIDGTTVTFTPDPDWHGEVYFELIVSDGNFDSYAIGEFMIDVLPVNDLPVILAGDIELDEDDSGSTEIEIIDVEDDFAERELVATVKTEPANGSVQIVDGIATYTPGADVNGEDSFVLTVTDFDGGTDEVTVKVLTNPANDAPVAAECPTATVVAGESVELEITGCATDIDGDDLTMVPGSATSEDGEVAKINGVLTFTPREDVRGEATVELRIGDGDASVGVVVNVTVTAPAPPQYVGVDGREGQLVRIYAAMLGRLPDQGGFDYWTALLEDGLTIEAMVAEFGRSPEFKDTYGNRMANDSDADWVTFVYDQVLDRSPDAAGRAYWEGLLESGELSRADMVVWFAESDEFKRSTQTL